MKRPVVAIGIFDGVHRGHQAILKRAVSRARVTSGTPVALTFYPHPLTILKPSVAPPLILSLKGRTEAMKQRGIKQVVVCAFTRRFSRLSPEQFVDQVLVKKLRAQQVVVGHDFGFGKGRKGSIRTLRVLGNQRGFRVLVVGPQRVGRERISSRLIRRSIQSGRLDFARRCLGVSPSLEGQVVRGAGRGKKMGVPTANIKVTSGVLPPCGVYAVWVKGAGPRVVLGVANLGFRPTVGGKRTTQPVLEVHFLGSMHRKLRGKVLQVALGTQLRNERKFPSLKALVAQIKQDKVRARHWLRRHNRWN